MYKIGLSSCAFAPTEENFKELKNSGIEAIEISIPKSVHDTLNHARLAELSKRYGVALWSYHLPFEPFEVLDVSSTDEKLRASTVRYYETLIEKAAAIGIDKFVVHPSAEPIENDREARLAAAMKSLDELAEFACRFGAVIAVEDLPRTCLGNTAQELSRLISVNDKLRVCLDTNHLLQGTNQECIRLLGDKIVTLHVSDYDFTNEKHWLPGEGSVDWQAVLSALREARYDGVWLYELSFKAPATITRSRDLTFADIADNARALFRGETPINIL